MVDMQEMVVWTALNWRISKWDDISCQCDKLASSLGGCVARPWDACVNRLLIRGLLVSGCGETEFDALYDLLSSLGVIPTNGSAFVRGVSAAKLVLSRRITMKQAKCTPVSPQSHGYFEDSLHPRYDANPAEVQAESAKSPQG